MMHKSKILNELKANLDFLCERACRASLKNLSLFFIFYDKVAILEKLTFSYHISLFLNWSILFNSKLILINNQSIKKHIGNNCDIKKKLIYINNFYIITLISKCLILLIYASLDHKLGSIPTHRSTLGMVHCPRLKSFYRFFSRLAARFKIFHY